MSSGNYTLLSTGWGKSCPNGTLPVPKANCLQAAQSVISKDKGILKILYENEALHHQQRGIDSTHSNYSNTGSTAGEDLSLVQQHFDKLYENEYWDYSPCGCFVYKAERIMYAIAEDTEGDITNAIADANTSSRKVQCKQNRFTQLVCEVSGEVEQMNEDDMRSTGVTYYDFLTKGIDWTGYLLLHFQEDRSLCLASRHDEQQEQKRGQSSLYIGKCKDVTDSPLKNLPGKEWALSPDGQIETQTRCKKKSGEGYGFCVMTMINMNNSTDDANHTSQSPKLSMEYNDGTIEQLWYFNADGRIQNKLNSSYYISVVGCNVVENATIEIATKRDNCGQILLVSSL